jgi:hypothetical protein
MLQVLALDGPPFGRPRPTPAEVQASRTCSQKAHPPRAG